MKSENGTAQPEWKTTRFYLAIGVTVVSIVSVAILARTIILHSGDPTKTQASQGVLNAVLPLLGTWVGTILAFYFSKENFEAAARSVTEIAKQMTSQEKLKSIPVAAKMIPKAEVFFKTLPADKDKPLLGLLGELEQKKKGQRIPILSDDGRPLYVIHRSSINSYLVAQAASPAKPDLAKLTLQNLIDSSASTLKNSFALVRKDATLADAKAAMEQLEGCQDVFVTETGKREEPVVGWITNVIIQQNAEV